MKLIPLVIYLFFVSILLVSCTQKQQSNFIRISASESIDVPVDYAIIEIGISNQNKDVVKLDSLSHQTLTQLLCIFKMYEIKEVFTQNSEIGSDYDNKDVLTMSQSYKAKIHNLKEIDSFRRDLIKVGCNVFKIESYGSDSLKKYQEILYGRCIDAAIDKANKMTKTGSIKIGKISRILDGRDNYGEDELRFEEITDPELFGSGGFACAQLGIEKKQIEPTIVKKSFEINGTMTVYFEIQK